MDKDKEILALIKSDESFERGFQILVSTYKERLYWHIRRIVHFHDDADDVLQNVFIKVFKNIKGFEAQAKLYTWMYRIATNESITFINKRKKQQVLGQEHLEHLSERLRADSYFDAEEANIKLVQAIETLPEKQKLIFNMRYYDEMPYGEISSILDTSVGALKANFHHALKKVEAYLKDNLEYVE